MEPTGSGSTYRRDQKQDPVVVVKDYRNKIIRDAELLVSQIFPMQILELDDLLKFLPASPVTRQPSVDNNNNNNTNTNNCKKKKNDGRRYILHNNNSISDSNDVTTLPAATSISPPKRPDRRSKAWKLHQHNYDSSEVISLYAKLKPLVQNLADHSALVRMWITYLIPRIDCVKSVGLKIQDDTFEKLRPLDIYCKAILDSLSAYFSLRDSLQSKCEKYPEIDEYRESQLEIDRQHYAKLFVAAKEIREHYISLLNLILKCFDKIQQIRQDSEIIKPVKYIR